MESHKIEISLVEAMPIIEHCLKVFGPACQRIELVGSARRGKQLIGDAEIVCIPKVQLNLLDEEYPILDMFIADLLAQDKEGIASMTINGPRQKQFSLKIEPAFFFDFHITDAARWGYKVAIHTGPWAFSKQLVTPRKYQTEEGRPGLMPSNLKVKDCLYWDGKQIVPTPEEIDVLKLTIGKWVVPNERL
jgi:DNA polymerase/3'-5' exonuclease PolX